MEGYKFGVYIGRLSPMHKGHEAVINTMITDFGYSNSAVLLGSPNVPLSERHLFSYIRRRSFVKRVYPNMKVVPLPDFDNDNFSWITVLDDLLLLMGYQRNDVIFYGGGEEDVQVLTDFGFKTKILDRTSGVTPIVSATEIKEKLAKGESIADLVHMKNQDTIVACYHYSIQTLKSKEDDKRSVQSGSSDNEQPKQV